jgi:hypothetical protein
MEVVAQMLQQDGHFKLKVNGGDYRRGSSPPIFAAAASTRASAWMSGNMQGADMDAELWSFYAPDSRSDGIYSWDDVPRLEP